MASAAAVAVAVVVASVAAFVLVRAQLRRQVDRALVRRAEEVSVFFGGAAGGRFEIFGTYPHVPPPRYGGPGGYAQVIAADGSVLRDPDQQGLPVTDNARAVARGSHNATFEDVRTGGSHVRVLTIPLSPGLALQVARPLDETDVILHRFELMLLALCIGGIGLAAGLGRAVAHTALTPVQQLTDAAEQIAQTRDLAHRIAGRGDGEMGRLASSFNSMLEALDESLVAQRRLVADASHELRTPLTSLKTNVEVLTRASELSPGERAKILADVTAQLNELTGLLGDLIELARGEQPEMLFEDVRLDLLVERAVNQVRPRWPGVVFVTDLQPTLVRGVPERLNRALGNLLDNAAKWSPVGGRVEVSVANGEVAVRDHGAGIAGEDLPHVFDRFYRAASARGLPGSGLGLAIVKQVADLHGAAVSAERAKEGGSIFRLRLPVEEFIAEPAKPKDASGRETPASE
jgi:two-component system sensor histidine kinase MprB